VHTRTTNPVESTFATVRLRTDKTRGCLLRETLLAMVLKLCMSTQKRWRRLKVAHCLTDVCRGIASRMAYELSRRPPESAIHNN
jgi:hypothetical protein